MPDEANAPDEKALRELLMESYVLPRHEAAELPAAHFLVVPNTVYVRDLSKSADGLIQKKIGLLETCLLFDGWAVELLRVRRAGRILPTNRGDAATWNFRGDDRRRGRDDVELPRRRATPRPRRGISAETPRPPKGNSLSRPRALGTFAERRSCPFLLILLCTSRGRHQHSNATRMSSNGARTAEIGSAPAGTRSRERRACRTSRRAPRFIKRARPRTISCCWRGASSRSNSTSRARRRRSRPFREGRSSAWWRPGAGFPTTERQRARRRPARSATRPPGAATRLQRRLRLRGPSASSASPRPICAMIRVGNIPANSSPAQVPADAFRRALLGKPRAAALARQLAAKREAWEAVRRDCARRSPRPRAEETKPVFADVGTRDSSFLADVRHHPSSLRTSAPR